MEGMGFISVWAAPRNCPIDWMNGITGVKFSDWRFAVFITMLVVLSGYYYPLLPSLARDAKLENRHCYMNTRYLCQTIISLSMDMVREGLELYCKK